MITILISYNVTRHHVPLLSLGSVLRWLLHFSNHTGAMYIDVVDDDLYIGTN